MMKRLITILFTVLLSGLLCSAQKISDSGSQVVRGVTFQLLDDIIYRHPMPKRKRDRQAFHNPQHCGCGEVNRSLKLSERHWTCMSCGTYHDRDYNASVNIKNFGLSQTLPGDTRKVTPVDCPPADDRQLAGLRSSDRVNQEKFRGVTDAPVL